MNNINDNWMDKYESLADFYEDPKYEGYMDDVFVAKSISDNDGYITNGELAVRIGLCKDRILVGNISPEHDAEITNALNRIIKKLRFSKLGTDFLCNCDGTEYVFKRGDYSYQSENTDDIFYMYIMVLSQLYHSGLNMDCVGAFQTKLAFSRRMTDAHMDERVAFRDMNGYFDFENEIVKKNRAA